MGVLPLESRAALNASIFVPDRVYFCLHKPVPLRMDVKITFRSSAPEHLDSAAGLHEQIIPDVPVTEAERMVEDFTRYQTAAPEAIRRMRYQFARRGKDVLVALDFDHVVALTAVEEKEDSGGEGA